MVKWGAIKVMLNGKEIKGIKSLEYGGSTIYNGSYTENRMTFHEKLLYSISRGNPADPSFALDTSKIKMYRVFGWPHSRNGQHVISWEYIDYDGTKYRSPPCDSADYHAIWALVRITYSQFIEQVIKLRPAKFLDKGPFPDSRFWCK